MPEEFDEALEAARAEWASEHDSPAEYHDHTEPEAPMMPGYRCIDLSQLSSHDLRVVDEALARYRSKHRAPQSRLRWLVW